MITNPKSDREKATGRPDQEDCVHEYEDLRPGVSRCKHCRAAMRVVPIRMTSLRPGAPLPGTRDEEAL